MCEYYWFMCFVIVLFIVLLSANLTKLFDFFVTLGMEIFVDEYVAPCGRLVIGECAGAICLCDWALEPRHSRVVSSLGQVRPVWRRTELLAQARRLLDAYFGGEQVEFNLPLSLQGGTEFRRRVWRELLAVPYGSTLTYGELAARVGSHPRPVASAVGANPMSILIPCHRIVGADNKIGGYAGGVAAKEYLLRLEEVSARVRG